MTSKIARFTEAPIAAIGGPEGPGVRLTLGWAARALAGNPSKEIRPWVDIERHWPSVRVRMWFANESGRMWFSPGYHTLALHKYVHAKALSVWRRWRNKIPRAWTVQR